MSATEAGRAVHRAADSRALEMTGRAGYVTRGAIYLLVGVIALQISAGRGGQADRGGALTQIAAKSYGSYVLWLLVAGFAGLALSRLSAAVFSGAAHRTPGRDRDETADRLKALAGAALYGFFCVSTARLVMGASSTATANGNGQSKSLTAQVMSHGGGRVLIGLVGVGVVVVGVMLARDGWTKKFLKQLDLAHVTPRTRAVVGVLGTVGGIARGAVIALAGIFFVIAAVMFAPTKAEGMDGTLRAFAHTPAGPVLLGIVALGLIAFGVYSCCEARWRRV